jgi:tRNA(Ile2) C34 agmatinyltransferase TiaS
MNYHRGISLTSHEVLKATGLAVVAESDESLCPFCAEAIKKAAKKCKHCGADLTATI